MSDDTLARATYEAWRAWKIAHGHPDHKERGGWKLYTTRDDVYWACLDCGQPVSFHHPDMVGFDNLTPDEQSKYAQMGEAAASVERARWTGVAHPSSRPGED